MTTLSATTNVETLTGSASDDTFVFATGTAQAGDVVVGNGGADTIELGALDETIDLSVVDIGSVQSIVQPGSGSSDTVTISAAQFGGLTNIDLGHGLDTDVLNVNVTGSVDISGGTNPNLTSIDVINVNGTSGFEALTLNGDQLDQLLGSASTTINLGDGFDTIVLTSTSTLLNGLADANLIGVDKFSTFGASGAVNLSLANQSEGFVITSGTFGDVLTGSSGDDIYVLGVDDSRDVLDGGAGKDSIDYSGYTASLTVTLSGVTPAVVYGSGTSSETSDTIADIENFTGGAGDDAVTGDGLANILAGGRGNDTLSGGGGNDVLDGGAGNDIIHGGTGIDSVDFTGNRSDYTVTYSSGIFTVTDNRAGSPDGTDQIYWGGNNPASDDSVEFLEFADGKFAICFMAGTLIRTPQGEVAIEALKRGDLVSTTEGRIMPVTWLGRQTISTVFGDPLRVLPIRIRANALGENMPSRDLLISPDHAILIDGALIQAGALVNGSSIVRESNVPKSFTYYHVELEDHSLILAENTPAETFVDNVDRLAFDNWAEHQALYPEGRAVPELSYPRAKAYRQVPVRTRTRLAAQGMAAGYSIGEVA